MLDLILVPDCRVWQFLTRFQVLRRHKSLVQVHTTVAKCKSRGKSNKICVKNNENYSFGGRFNLGKGRQVC